MNDRYYQTWENIRGIKFLSKIYTNFFKVGINFLKIFSLQLFIIWDFFLILNPYNFVPLTAHIKLEIYYSNALEHRCSQWVRLMALNDTFTIQKINLDKKDLSYDNKLKKIENYRKNVQNIRVKTIARFFVIKNLTFRYSYAWFLHNARTK